MIWCLGKWDSYIKYEIELSSQFIKFSSLAFVQTASLLFCITE